MPACHSACRSAFLWHGPRLHLVFTALGGRSLGPSIPSATSAWQFALVGSATRTKTMPFGLVTCGLSGTPSQNWAVRSASGRLRYPHDQPGRQLHFLPAVLSGPPERPRIARPLPRDLAVPRLLGLLESAFGLSTSRVTLRPKSACMGPILVKLRFFVGVAS